MAIFLGIPTKTCKTVEMKHICHERKQQIVFQFLPWKFLKQANVSLNLQTHSHVKDWYQISIKTRYTYKGKAAKEQWSLKEEAKKNLTFPLRDIHSVCSRTPLAKGNGARSLKRFFQAFPSPGWKGSIG